MRGVIRLFLVPLVTLVFIGAGCAPASPPTPAVPAGAEGKAQRRERPKMTRLEGEVIAIDVEASTLTVKTKGEEMSFIVESKGAKARLAKAKVGKEIRLSYFERDGKLIADYLAGGLGGREPAKAPVKQPDVKRIETQEGAKPIAK